MEYGCIARKLGHSFSKEIHALIGGYDYKLCELEPDALADFFAARDFKAVNVTIPYKRDVIPFLDGIDEKAESIGAVNTVVNDGGKLFGFNTDFDGMRALTARLGSLKDKKVLILGSGGTSKTALAVARAGGAREAVCASRSGGKGFVTYGSLPADAQVIINTTPCGMFPDLESAAADLTRFGRLEFVADAVYNPLRTRLVLQARELGIPAEGGLYMLVAQAVYAAEKFFGKSLAAEDLTGRIYRKILKDKENTVLIGMPGCGKSTVGKAVAAATGRKFCDVDALIVQREKRDIPAIFAEGGEPLFRDIETREITALAPRQGLVIATGGGAVLRKENLRALRQNGRLYFIDRPLDLLRPGGGRPLSRDAESVRRLYEERIPIYRAACDERVDGTGGVNEVAERITEIEG